MVFHLYELYFFVHGIIKGYFLTFTTVRTFYKFLDYFDWLETMSRRRVPLIVTVIEQCQSVSHPSPILNLKRKKKKRTFSFRVLWNSLDISKAEKICLLSLLHFKHKINDFAAELIRALIFDVSDEIRGSRRNWWILGCEGAPKWQNS